MRTPRIGLLGIMQPLYDDMLPGITQRQADFAERLAVRLGPAVEVATAAPAKDRRDVEARVRELRAQDVDGLMVVMLTYGPSLRAVRALAEAGLPILLANVQPEASVGRTWTMDDMTCNQGVHGAQDLANALLRHEVRFDVVSEAWQGERFARRVEAWAHAAAAARAWRELTVAAFGHAMTATGDLRFDEVAFRRLGPAVEPVSLGTLARAMAEVTEAEVAALHQQEDARYQVDAALTPAAREEAARAELALRRLLDASDCGAYTVHFGAVAEDGRYARLPLSAASALMEAGYGYGAEGDAVTAALVAAGHVLSGAGHFTEMYAVDFEEDAVLLSHMGEGNPAFARDDEPVRLADRELGIGGLGRPPTTVFRLRPGPATLAALAPVGGDTFRLVIAEGEILNDAPIPALDMPYGSWRPLGGVRACMDDWLRQGGSHHQCLVMGHHAERWRRFGDIVGLDVVRVDGREES